MKFSPKKNAAIRTIATIKYFGGEERTLLEGILEVLDILDVLDILEVLKF